jgi:xylulokinase
MKNHYLLGIDIGTSSTKTTIIAPDGRLVSLASEEYTFMTPRPGWAELDPETWYLAAIHTIQKALQQSLIDPGEITGIGLTGLMHGPVFINKEGQSIRPSIIWADQRSGQQVKSLYDKISRETIAKWTGNPLATGFMLPTWLWIKENEVDTYNKTAYLLLPKDYIRYRLTGEIGCEPSDASATSLFNPFAGHWHSDLINALSLPHQVLPAISPSQEIAGTLLPEIAEITGLKNGTPVVYGGSDQTCQAIGNGITQPGFVSCTIGTGGQIFAVSNKPNYDPQLRLHTFCHVMPQTWHMLAATLTAGKSLRWLRDQVFIGSNYTELVDQALSVPSGAEGLLFLPYLAGERTPHMDPDAAAAFIGLTLRHTQSHMIRAVLEGVVFSLKQGFEIMIDLGVKVKKVIASGGATNHPLWLQLQADIFNQEIYRTQTKEAAAVGAALLAGVGAGVYNSVAHACQIAVHWEDEVIKPNLDNIDIYNQRYSVFSNLYDAIKPGC